MGGMLTLKAEMRSKTDKLEKIRKVGQIPAVFYGRKEASTPISIPKIDFLKVWKEAGESSIVTLETPEGVKESLIQDIDIDPMTGVPRHADFYVFEEGHKLEVDLTIEFVGISPAVKDLGGMLVKVLHELKIKAMPKDMPHNIKVDISSLTNFDDHILAQDIKLPVGVELEENPEEVVVLISAPREEKEEETAPVDFSTIEVEKKGKEETTEPNESEDKKETSSS
ncbi:MAG: 50S ribosomal protein L25 [Candidatus Zambryskibacteria bacterium CG_4_9_14_3_um_filter_42_9]|uniref:Large ribosomal subunit protein bL25 n=1 Tax=Candidatus Zambryskibacteria bacterium CG22_combo_CG10-13_8_21_14_all_42_17 TaxID=1975118 RepID=A0A2H0BDU1_9BACT|nr:MAG: 50S ribosomal protein L25 [Candidatus Zambryskibacteria bacterium CG22_combo_CG10-13_8_21_14_all_42_17]PJA37072.1 MAG: 50S ribosomal protein L25 [Candidatus Zambryskibacteria bacterium CG_4_9_14_3_um_filter_42_9]